jgi:hypothetical protein
VCPRTVLEAVGGGGGGGGICKVLVLDYHAMKTYPVLH